MSGNIGRRRILKFGLVTGAAALLPDARAHEYFTTNFTLIHPWTRASAPGATSAIVCMAFEDVIEPDRLVGLSTPLADGAEAGGDSAGAALNILIPRGKRTEFTEAGVHVRLVRLKLPMEMGREYPMTLDFARAGRLQATFLVDYAASA